MKIKNIKKHGTKIAIYSLTLALTIFVGKEVKNIIETNQKQYDLINEQLDALSQTIEKTNEEARRTNAPCKYTLTEEEAKILFYENGELIVDEIGEPYEAFHYENTYVRKILKDGKKYLVDADNICKVLLCNYDNYGRVFYNPYYTDGIIKGLYYYVVLKDDKHYIVNAKNFNIIITNYESFLLEYHTFYLMNYDHKHGGNDLGEFAGYITEITKNGIKYLTDAQDYSQILVSDYKEVTNCTEGILVTYPDNSQIVIPKEEFVPQKSDIMIRELVQSQKK